MDQNLTADALFFAPLERVLTDCVPLRECSKFPDHDFLKLGIHRVLNPVSSGRHFLQQLVPALKRVEPKVSNFFESLKSGRRRGLVRKTAALVYRHAKKVLPNRLFSVEEELKNFHIFCADGHWIEGATHDGHPSAGRFYRKDSRSGAVERIAIANPARRQEHDLAASVAATRRTGLNTFSSPTK